MARGLIDISEPMRFALSELPGEDERQDVPLDRRGLSHAMAVQLGLRHKYLDTDSQELLVALVLRIDDVMKSPKSKRLEEQGRPLVLETIKNLNQAQLMEIIRDLGYEDEQLPGDTPPRVRDIAKGLKAIVCTHLGDQLSEMLDRWYADGWFQEAERHRKMRPRPVTVEHRRDGLLPTYTPPTEPDLRRG